MEASKVREEVDEMCNKLNRAKIFIENSDNLQKEQFVTLLNHIDESISKIDNLVGKYTELQETMDELGEQKARLEGRLAESSSVSDPKDIDSNSEAAKVYREIQSDYQDVAEMVSELEEIIIRSINKNQDILDELGEKIATEMSYDPTDTNSHTKLDAATQAQLDSILNEVTSEEKPDWYEDS